MNNYKIKKVFDCQDMPQDLRDIFFNYMRENRSPRGNDCYIDWEIGTNSEPEEAEKLVDMWLVLNGANPATKDDYGKRVLIKHWW